VQGGEYTQRGTLTYTGPKLVTSKSKRLVSVQIEQSKFQSEDLAKLERLVDQGQPYRIRIQVSAREALRPAPSRLKRSVRRSNNAPMLVSGLI
jgi:hypothetical protein